MKRLLQCIALVLFAIAAGTTIAAETSASTTPASRDFPPGLQIPAAARPGPAFDVDAATAAYVGLLTPEQRAKSDAYFEGGYWIPLWGLIYGLAVGWFLLSSGTSRRMRDVARRIGRGPWRTAAIYAAFWLVVGYVLTLPWTIYVDFVREHQYGLATQTFGAWFLDQVKGLLVGIVIVSPVIALLYSAVRRTGSRWWVWASGGAFVFILFTAMIAPVFIAPLFNDYQPLPAGPVRDSVLSLAHANKIPTDHVEWFDASKQTTRVSANVSGFLGTTRVNLNDNLMNRTSLPEIKAVMGHEMGHYVLNHGLRLTVYTVLVLALGFFVVHVMFDRALARWGTRWNLEGRADPAALPLAVMILSTFFFVVSPLMNSIVRQAEAEADAYGLNAAREPHGFAMVSMRLSTYRKIAPGPLEETLFYDHPSGYARVHRSMTWLKENLDNPTANAPLPPTQAAAP